MKFRLHRGLLEDSMKTVVDIPATREALASEISRSWDEPVNHADLTVEPYGFDDRIHWDTHIVCVNGCAAGFTDQGVV